VIPKIEDDYVPKKRNADAKHVFSSPEGERLLAFLSRTEVWATTAGMATNALTTARQEGRRDLVIEITRWIQEERDGGTKRQHEAEK